MVTLPIRPMHAGAHDATHARNIEPRDSVTQALTRMLNDVMQETMAAVIRRPQGAQRIWLGLQTYLDACLKRPTIRVLVSTLQGHGAAESAIAASQQMLQRLIEADLAELDIPVAEAHARVFSAMARATQIAENEAAEAVLAMRGVLRRYVMGVCHAPR